MKAKVSVEFDAEKLCAMELELKKQHSSVQQRLTKALDELYEKTVSEPVREFIDSKAAAKPRRPPRPVPKPAPSKTNINKEGAQHGQ